jgi:hypothetical protein
MIVKTSYPVVVNGVNKTPDLYYDSPEDGFSNAQGRTKTVRKRKATKRPMSSRKPMAVRKPMASRKPMALKKSASPIKPMALRKSMSAKKPIRPVSTSGTRVVTLGTANKMLKAFDRPEFYNADGNDDYYGADGSGLNIFTTYPVIINKDRISPTDYYLNADGEEYLPFDGQTELLGFRDELGEEYFCGIDGEDFYNAKGEKVLGFFKKVGGGVVKAGKFIGKVAKKVGRAIVEASKKVAKGVKTAGGKIKAGAKKLIHHKTKAERTQSKADRDKKRANRKKEHDEKRAKRQKEINDAKAKGQTPPPPLPPLPPPSLTEGEKEPELKLGGDVFTQPLPPATPNTKPENVVDVAGKKYDATNVPKGKQIVETVNENGQAIAGVEFKPEEVIAVPGKDGNIEYYTPEAQGMSKGLKIALIVGGSLLVLGVVGYLIFRNKGKASKTS